MKRKVSALVTMRNVVGPIQPRPPAKPQPDETRAVALTRAEADAILDALLCLGHFARLSGESIPAGAVLAHRKIVALWPTTPAPTPRRRRKS